MAYVAAAAMVVGAVGSIMEGAAAKKKAEKDAQIAEENAGLAQQESKEEARRSMIVARKQIGDERASYAASGVGMTGSALDVIAESQENARLDELTILRGGEIKANMYRQDAQSERDYGSGARTGSYFRAAGQLGAAAGAAYGAGNKGGK